jgi:hypothetical protein
MFKDEQGVDSLLMRSVFQQELAKRGVLFLTGFNIGYSLSDADVEQTLEASRDALSLLAAALKGDRLEDVLEGPPVQPVFRQP